mgnify:CR=1 FL=1
MGVLKISKISVILPRSQLSLAMEKLFRFETFHAQQSDSSHYDELLDDYSKRSLRIYVKLSELIKELKLKPTPGILDTLKDGYNISAEKLELNKWEDILSILENKTDPIITLILDPKLSFFLILLFLRLINNIYIIKKIIITKSII